MVLREGVLIGWNALIQIIRVLARLDFQPLCEPAFLAPHHGWITGLPIVFFDQSQPSLLKSSRLPCDWLIVSLVYPTWRMSVLTIDE